MPKRVIDFDALWASEKIAGCADWAQAEYAWLYGLADASGCFELTNLRVIWGRVAAIRKNLSIEKLAAVIEEFTAHGLLFTWEENGKRYGHWTGSDVPGRLPAPSWRVRLERLAPPLPRAELAAYVSRYSSRRMSPDTCIETVATNSAPQIERELQLNLSLERPQAQDLDLDWDRNVNLSEKQKANTAQACASDRASLDVHDQNRTRQDEAAHMLETYEAERGSLPAAQQLTAERRLQCAARLAAGLTVAQFGAAVRRAAATPFLAGAGERGWRASFDWLVANDTNARKVLDGCYDGAAINAGVTDFVSPCSASDQPGPPGTHAQPNAHSQAAHSSGIRVRSTGYVPAALYAGAAPPGAASGIRVKPATLARIRAREARGAPFDDQRNVSATHHGGQLVAQSCEPIHASDYATAPRSYSSATGKAREEKAS
jgi:hypothetical protein